MTGLLLQVPGARLRHPAADLADAVPVSQMTWTSAQHITADVPERQTCLRPSADHAS